MLAVGLALTACVGGPAEEPVPSASLPGVYLYVPETSPEVAERCGLLEEAPGVATHAELPPPLREALPFGEYLSCLYPGATLLVDPRPELPLGEPRVQVLAAGSVAAARAARGQDTGIECSVPIEPVYEPECGPAINPGASCLPDEIDETWKGYGKGGCGTWATAMCNRVLRLTDPQDGVTKDEWNDIAPKIGQDDDGSADFDGQAEYYKKMGYCVETKKFTGDKASYEEMEKYIDEGCDVKLGFWKRVKNEDGSVELVNGHFETVLEADADKRSCKTNSWGDISDVTGGADGGFTHSGADSMNDRPGETDLWPADSTEVEVQYICPCSVTGGTPEWI
ncbi:MAG: hypothetical protein IT285_07165 [Bdellovibrionales bacterium]|nr:hypothetical protein [Bdellovibrionales bacterium]